MGAGDQNAGVSRSHVDSQRCAQRAAEEDPIALTRFPQSEIPPVLATCGIRRPELAYEDTQSCLLFLANFPEKVYNLRHSPAQLHKGGWILCKAFSSSSCSWYACVFDRSITATSLGSIQTPPPSCWGR